MDGDMKVREGEEAHGRQRIEMIMIMMMKRDGALGPCEGLHQSSNYN